MKRRVGYRGADLDGRNTDGKLRSFHAALENSYQSEWITLHKDDVDKEGNSLAKPFKCLINPSRLTEQFDKKVISIDFESGMQEGDVFYWDRTEAYWIVNLKQDTEEAYFRGIIKRCEYQVDVDGTKYWVSLEGPDEESIAWRNKHNIYFNDLNYSMSFIIAKNSQTVNYFTRFQKIKMKNSYPDVETGETIEEYHNWQVVATDKYSSDRVMEVYLLEDFDNEMEDKMIKPVAEEQDTSQPYIDGPQFVKPYDTNLGYFIKNLTGGRFVVNSKKVKIIDSTESSCVLEIITGKSANFKISYIVDDSSAAELDVTIQSF